MRPNRDGGAVCPVVRSLSRRSGTEVAPGPSVRTRRSSPPDLATPADRGRARPVGRRALSRVGAAGRAGRGRTGRPAGWPRRGAPRVPFRPRSRRRGRSDGTRTASTTARPAPIPRPDSSLTDLTGRPRSSIRPPFPGPMPGGRASRARARSSTRCTSGRSRPPAPGRRPARELPELARAGITVVEVLPVADFAGDFGWGYDGVDFFAPTRLYGRPDDFRAFVDRAHAVGAGRDPRRRVQPLRPGRQLPRRSSAPHYLSTRHRTDWGAAINFDGDGLRAGPRVLRRRTPATGSTSSIWTGSAWTPRRTSTTTSPGARADGDRAPGAGACRPPVRVPRRRERAAGRAARPRRWRPAATASTRCGTTTSTTAPRSPSPGAPRPTTATTPGRPRS